MDIHASRRAVEELNSLYAEMNGYKIEPPKEKLKTDRNMFNIPKSEQDAARERIKAKTAAKRAKMSEGDAADEASMKKFQALQKNVDQKRKLNIRGNDSAEQKARLEKKRGMKLDDHPQFKKEEVDPEKSKKIRKKLPHMGTGNPHYDAKSAGSSRVKDFKFTPVKEAYSSWRNDLSEVMTDDISDKPIKEKKVSNTIKINPKLGEAIEAMGGELLEATEVDEAMMAGPRKDAMAKKINTAKSGSDRATAFNLATRNDMGSSYQKKSTGGKGKRFPGYGDRGAGNKAARRMGKTPMNQGPEKRVTEAVYGGTPKEEPKDTRMTVTNADKRGNTPAYQRFKAGDKRYKAADHMKEQAAMSDAEVKLQKQKARIDQMIAQRRKQDLVKKSEEPTKVMGEGKGDPCWDTHKQVGMKKKGGRMVPNCVPKEELSIEQQMKISRDAAKGRNPKPDHKAIRGKMLKSPLPKDTRTDAQKMTDATGPRPGSRYRGD